MSRADRPPVSGEPLTEAVGVEVRGVLYHDDWQKGATIDVDEFTDAFIEFVESRQWGFGGTTTPVDEQGNPARLAEQEGE